MDKVAGLISKFSTIVSISLEPEPAINLSFKYWTVAKEIISLIREGNLPSLLNNLAK